jgi:hypothetical protein
MNLRKEHEYEQRIDNLGLQLFAHIESQSTAGDRKSWLALQRAVRRAREQYAYLEIGSHLGGSIQPHLVDPRCSKIFSIDPRPLEQPDARGPTFRYEGNSTERMLENLRRIDSTQTPKITCFDCDASEVDSTVMEPPPDICFIDGEHTYSAVLSDFEFCLKVVSSNGVICFHDCWFLAPILSVIEKSLRVRSVPFASFKMMDDTYAIALANCPVIYDEIVNRLSTKGSKFLYKRELVAFVKRYLPESVVLAVRWIKSIMWKGRY